MKRKLYIALLLSLAALPTPAQEETDKNETKAWELGLGGTVFQFSRVGFSNFSQPANGYTFDLDLNHAVWGGSLYAARELNKHFYLDLQGSFGLTNKSIDRKTRLMTMVGAGLQWRLGEYFKSSYVDPYLRAGINYMYKDFQIRYDGSEGTAPDEMSWILSNYGNKEGHDRKHLAPIALGGGINFWLNDRIGVGLQADYLLMPHKNVANSLQGSARIMWRIGGKSKKPRPVVQYVEKPVERIVEKVVEKIVEKPAAPTTDQSLIGLFDQIYFDFDSHEITPESGKILDKIAALFLQDTTRRYLITGQTDARGSSAYNHMMKWRGVGKKIAIATPEAPNQTRRGDRKTTVELITNPDYWECIPTPKAD